MFSLRGPIVTGPTQLVASDDGITWDRVRLPDEPESLIATLGMRRVGDVLTLVGRTADASGFGDVVIHAWTTTDARDWRGGSVDGGPDMFSFPPVLDVDGEHVIGVSHPDRTLSVSRQHADGSWKGRTVEGLTLGADFPGEGATVESMRTDGGDWIGTVRFAGVNPRSERGIIRSPQGGTRWTYAGCTDPVDCAPVTGLAGLQLRDDQVSTDGGATWQRVRITPTPLAEAETVRLVDAVRIDGGWLAVGDASPPGDRAYGFLLRSTNGRDWRSLHHDPCPRRSGGRPDSGYTLPVPANGFWWSLYSCRHLSDPDLAQVLVGSVDGTSWTVAADLGARNVNALVPVGDRLVVPFQQEQTSIMDRVAIITP